MNENIKGLLDKYTPEELESMGIKNYSSVPALDEELSSMSNSKQSAVSPDSLPLEFEPVSEEPKVSPKKTPNFKSDRNALAHKEGDYPESIGNAPSASRTTEVPANAPTIDLSQPKKSSSGSFLSGFNRPEYDPSLNDFQNEQLQADYRERMAMIQKAANQFGHSFQGAGPADTSIEDERIKSSQERMRRYTEWKKSEEDRKTRLQTAKLAAQAKADADRDRAEAKILAAKEKAEAKKERDLNDDVKKYGAKQEQYSPIQSAIDNIDEAVGFDVDKATFDKSGNIIVDGKKVDLPGVNIPGLGRYSFYNEGARGIADTTQSIINRELKTRSGAAVTSNELERIRSDFKTGKFNTEAEMIKGMQAYKREVKKALAAAEAGYTPEVKAKYRENQSLPPENTNPTQNNPPPTNKVETTKVDGKEYKTTNGVKYEKVDGGWVKVK